MKNPSLGQGGRDETPLEQMQRQENDIDRANWQGVGFAKIVGEGQPAEVHEFGETDNDGYPREQVYKQRGEGALGPTNTLKGG